MADRKDDESDDRDQDELDEPEGKGASDEAEAKRPSARPVKRSSKEADAGDEAEEDADADADAESGNATDGASEAETEADAADAADAADDVDAAARTATDTDEDEEILPTQLGTQRYVFAAFFGGVILFAYVLGKLIHGVWSWAANREWFYGRFPGLAAVTDESKTVYGLVVGAFVALVLGIRTFRKPDVRRWTDEVTAEMTKVKWPTRKEVYASTVVVIAGSLIACAYLFLLDQFWSFVTGLIYGTGS